MPFLHWLSFQRRIIFIFIFSVCIFKLSFGFTSHCLCWLAQHRRKQAKTLTDKTKSRLEGANGKGENESHSPLKTKLLQKGPKRRTNQTGLKKSSCPPASPQLSRSSSSSCLLSSSSECRLFLKRKENWTTQNSRNTSMHKRAWIPPPKQPKEAKADQILMLAPNT